MSSKKKWKNLFYNDGKTCYNENTQNKMEASGMRYFNRNVHSQKKSTFLIVVVALLLVAFLFSIVAMVFV